MPPGTTELVFSGSTILGSSPIFTASRPPQRRILLANVPLAVKVLSIAYMNGSTLIGLFEGIVDVQSFTVLRNPPWVTRPPCTAASPDEEGLFGADLDGFGRFLNPLALSRPVPDPLPGTVTLDALPPSACRARSASSARRGAEGPAWLDDWVLAGARKRLPIVLTRNETICT